MSPSGCHPSLLGATGRFAVRRLLGNGESAEVYEVFDRQEQQRVALKLLRAGKRNATERKRLVREYDALQRVQHPNLVVCHELFLEDQDAYFTMELVEGTNFVEYVRADARSAPGRASAAWSPPRGGSGAWPRSASGPPSHPPPARKSRPTLPARREFVWCGEPGLERLRRVLPQLVRGVEALHSVGIVHRDLQPENVRVTFGGRLVVIDYGIAARLHDDRRSPEGIVGTAAYMSPEEYDRQARSAASDWYGVGLLLFEAVTGTLPFVGDDHEILVRKRTLSAPRPSSIVPVVPRDLDELCVKLLERNPQARPSGPSILAQLEAA